MHYFELTCTAYLKREIGFQESFETISKYISFSFIKGGLEQIHDKDGFKHYVFSTFRPSEEDVKNRAFKEGNTYAFTIRSLDENFIKTLAKTLRENINNSDFLVLQTSSKTIKQFFISELYTATPTIVTLKNMINWTLEKSGDLMLLNKQLQDNLEKKYQSYFGKDIKPSQSFIQLIEIKNRKPQNIVIYKSGKKVTFFGNKFKIVPNEDEISQKLAFVALACGLGEKNSYGGGFCLAGGVR